MVEIMNYINDKYIRKNMVEVGQDAPSVKVKLTDKEKINEDFELRTAYNKGSTVLYFFPAAFTGVCTQTSCALRDDIEEFSKLKTQIFGISVDMPFTHKKFITDNNLNYPVLSDWNKQAINAFKIKDENFAGGLTGVAKRALFLIKESKIIYKWVADSPGNYPPFDELKAKL